MSNSPTENPLRESEVELKGKSKEEVSNDTPKKVVKKKKYFPGFKPYEERGCTDCLCCILFLLFLGGWFGLMIFAFMKGKPEVLYRATDYKCTFVVSICKLTTRSITERPLMTR